MGGAFVINDNALSTIAGFNSLETVGGWGFEISFNYSLSTIEGFSSLATVRFFSIDFNDALTTIDGFDNLATVGLTFRIIGNNAALQILCPSFQMLASIGGGINDPTVNPGCVAP